MECLFSIDISERVTMAFCISFCSPSTKFRNHDLLNRETPLPERASWRHCAPRVHLLQPSVHLGFNCAINEPNASHKLALERASPSNRWEKCRISDFVEDSTGLLIKRNCQLSTRFNNLKTWNIK
ncbi:hypothetical protein CDAR_20551 [Caerostris darwini]|uniref:Uncharacterized protein n=1 Tax=Caerostris darwini TaxID=1538125 RepID=A0AAV4QC69_9ARAC|nr:hypothetical protein CDAR_20551 [Caerostris darwini]